MEREVHEYQGEAITVTYDVTRCIHARECVRGLPAVFDPNRRPWIDPDAAPADELAAVIARCPTGALHFDRSDGGPPEGVPEENTVAVAPGGPLYARGDVEVVAPDGRALLSDTRVAFCRCGASANKPLCDNSHATIDFSAPGTLPASGSDSTGTDRAGDGGEAGAETDEGEDEIDGVGGDSAPQLTVIPTRDGPLELDGRFTLVGGDDGSTLDGDGATLCRCGGSSNKPFCDGTHARIGFSTGSD